MKTLNAPLRVALTLAVALAVLMAAMGYACDACIEDKMVSTYDHGVVERATVSGDMMVYCSVSGPFDARRLTAALQRVRSVTPQSVRISLESAALSFSVNPKVQSPQAAIDAAQLDIPAGTRLTLVRVLTTLPRASLVEVRKSP